ncbi:MAG: STAS domain-containing protein [Bdellovibrionales bacterium]|nr:STAS domain-containing protein [Bdellovibrionales bacterium]
MKARIKNTNESIIISLDGKVDYETQDEVCNLINRTVSQNQNRTDQTAKKIILNLKELEFVGSSGITQFVQSLKAIHQQTDIVPKYCGVRSEFKKIMKAFDETNEFDFYDDEALSKKNGKPVLEQ